MCSVVHKLMMAVLFPRHLTPQRMEEVISHIQTFRDYFHYHIKASKAYIHSRMRKRTADFLQGKRQNRMQKSEDVMSNSASLAPRSSRERGKGEEDSYWAIFPGTRKLRQCSKIEDNQACGWWVLNLWQFAMGLESCYIGLERINSNNNETCQTGCRIGVIFSPYPKLTDGPLTRWEVHAVSPAKFNARESRVNGFSADATHLILLQRGLPSNSSRPQQRGAAPPRPSGHKDDGMAFWIVRNWQRLQPR